MQPPPEPPFLLHKLKSQSKQHDLPFRLFKDDQVIIENTSCPMPVIESIQDDDVDTDDEVMAGGKNRCFQDLRVIKEFYRLDPHKL